MKLIRRNIVSSVVVLLGTLAALCSCTQDNMTSEGAYTIKVGTYNLWCAHSRTKKLSADPDIDTQRYWKPSSVAMNAIIDEMDCDIYAFQEIGDSIYGKIGAETSLKVHMEKEGYEWRIWSNVDGTPVTGQSGRLTYSPGICYRVSLFTLLSGGVFWLGGNPAEPEFVRTENFDPEYGDPKRACVWARMRHKPSGKVFYFMSAHLDTRSFSGVSYPMVNDRNCINLMSHADEFIVPEGVPSIIAGDMNVGPTGSGYAYLMNHEGRRHMWKDAYSIAGDAGTLGVTAKNSPFTNNSAKGEIGTSRIDHVFVEGFEVMNYDINQKKYKTASGMEHFPSDHFPVIVTLQLSKL